MNKKPLDRRVKRTRSNLRASITRLIYQKPVNEITVREISEGADINRDTFYLHYKDVYDMIDRIENDMFEEFEKIVTSHAPEDFKEQPFLILNDIFSFLKDNADMCAALLSPNGDIAFVNKLKNVLRDKCYSDWEKLYHTDKQVNFAPYYNFIISGAIGLLTYWLNNDMKESPEEMATLAEKMIINGISVLEDPEPASTPVS